MSEITYALDAMRDYGRVLNGEKPLLIVSEGRSTQAYEAAAEMAGDNPLMMARFATFVCEDGELHEHVFIALADSTYADEAIQLVYDAVNQAEMTREQLQLRLGRLLGYSVADCLAFMRSYVGLTCKCDCCGGEPQKLLTYTPTRNDADKARSMEFAYKF